MKHKFNYDTSLRSKFSFILCPFSGLPGGIVDMWTDTMDIK